MVMDSLQGYAYPRKALSDMIRRGQLLRIKKGVYVQSGAGIEPFSRLILANMIYGPSHVSYESALSYHGLIPERVEEITSATMGKAKLFSTPAGRFRYRHQPRAYYCTGYERLSLGPRRGYLIATPEKALADRTLLERGRFSRRAMREFLFENIRLDEEDFRGLDTQQLVVLAQRSGRRCLHVLCAVKKELA
jgi:hypothetical protein